MLHRLIKQKHDSDFIRLSWVP